MAALVLIADGDAERAKRIEEACASLGFATSAASHGAAALETALVEPPDVVVAPFDLPLIDARKLADILRANPRTRDVGFVFLGRPEPGTEEPEVSDEVVPDPTQPEEVVRQVEALLARRGRVDEVGQQADTDTEVEGKLSRIALADLLQLFHVNAKTGTLELSRQGADGRKEEGVVHLHDGEAVQATVGSVKGEKALFRLLAWKEGAFAFTPRRANVPREINTALRALLMEGMRQLDEASQLDSALPPAQAHVTLRVKSADLPNMVHPLTQEVLLLLEIYTCVQDVVDRCSFPDYQVLRTLQTLMERGLVEVRRAPTPAPGALGEGLFAPAQARRLRDWLEGGRAKGTPLRDAKLLLVSADQSATVDFVRLLRGLAGVRLEGPFAGGTFSPDDLATVARVPVDGDAGLELIQLPVGDAFAPLWPAVGHGALGSLILLSGRVERASKAVAGPLRALRAIPRARIFHVLLLQKGERHLPEDLRESLDLIDDASLFLVPLKSGNEPSEVLRSLFARVLP